VERRFISARNITGGDFYGLSLSDDIIKVKGVIRNGGRGKGEND